MSVTLKAMIPATQLTSSAATYYTATRVTARIDNFTVTNTDSSAHQLTVYLVASGGSAGDSNTIIDTKSILPGETYTCPEMIGKILPVGSFIQAMADANTVLTISAGGIEFT